ncbi:phage holin family protein [Streptomyces lydicus]|uniref:phage holin family protein n=1 Tax=Streptomyces lydicus TaxID=47763 RepID=UPI0037A1052B
MSSLTLLLLAALLPDFRLQSGSGDSLTRTAFTAALGAGAFGLLSALVWPLLVRALLLVPALVLGLLVFFLNGSLLLLALDLIPAGRGQAAPETAVIVAAAMSAASSATSAFLAVRNDEAYHRRLVRLAGRRRTRRAPPRPDTPGTVFLQLVGLGHDLLREAIRGERPLMPTVARWTGTSHRLTPWRTDWSSQTGASQLALLHGSNEDLPAFRWYEKDTGRLVVSNRPTSAAELQRRAVERTGDGGLLACDGASRGNLFSGGADQVALVMSVAARRGRHNRSRAGYFASLSALVRAGCGLPVRWRAGRTPSGAEAREAARAALHRPEEPVGDAPGDAGPVECDGNTPHPLVLASGNLGLVSFPDVPGRLTREELDRRHPALLGTLTDHPGIGFVLVRSAEHGPVALGPAGAHRLDTGRVLGSDPLAPFGADAAAAVRRTAHFPHAADLMINAACDPATGAVHAFEEQIGSHGGLGGAQSHPFLLWPAELTPPSPDGEPLTGAEAVHRVLRRWLREADGPQLPLEEATNEPSGR